MNTKRMPNRAMTALLLLFFASPVAAEPQVGDRFGNWAFECLARSATDTDCGIAQTVVTENSKEPIARFRIKGPKNDDPGMITVLLPLGIDLRTDLSAKIDETGEFSLQPIACTAQGCAFEAPIDETTSELLKAGARISIGFTLTPQNLRISVVGSLIGIEEAFAATGWY